MQRAGNSRLRKCPDVIIDVVVADPATFEQLLNHFQINLPAVSSSDHDGNRSLILRWTHQRYDTFARLVRAGFNQIEFVAYDFAVAFNTTQNGIIGMTRTALTHIIETGEEERVAHELRIPRNLVTVRVNDGVHCAALGGPDLLPLGREAVIAGVLAFGDLF